MNSDSKSHGFALKRKKVSHPPLPRDTTIPLTTTAAAAAATTTTADAAAAAHNLDSSTSASAVTNLTPTNHDDHQNSHTILHWNQLIPVDIRLEIYAMVDFEIQTRVAWYPKYERLETETINPQNILERQLFTAALINDMEALQTLLPSLSRQSENILSERIHPSVAAILARFGHLATLQWISTKQKLLMTPKICESAVFGGHPRILHWLLCRHKIHDSWRNVDICVNAVYSGQLDLFKWLHEHGCSWSEIISEVAARLGCLEILQYAHEHGCPWNTKTCREAAYHGHLEILKYAHGQGCPWDQETCKEAAYRGDLDILKYAHEQGCPWNTEICFSAALGGHLDILKYAHEQGCPWDQRTSSEAAYQGYLDILKYAHENGCPWFEETCTSAAMNGNVDILKYAHEHGCPWDDTTFEGAFMCNKLESVRYAYEHGCPWDEEWYQPICGTRRIFPRWAHKYFREQKKKQSQGWKRQRF